MLRPYNNQWLIKAGERLLAIMERNILDNRPPKPSLLTYIIILIVIVIVIIVILALLGPAMGTINSTWNDL